MRLTIPLLLTLFFTVRLCAQEMHPKYIKITPDIQAKIKAGLPQKFAVPATKRHILVYSKSSGFIHKSTSVGIEAFRQLAAVTGAFEVTFNDNPASYTADYLKQFDAILVNNATHIGKAFAEENRKAFMDFIKAGKGFVGIHAASDSGHKIWLEYSQMIGGCFDGHPWGQNGKWAMEVNDTSNPINEPFKEKYFIFQDEIYRQSHSYKKENMHTLVKIDPKKDPLGLRGKVVHNREYPISWMKKHGQGKVFYTCFGHRPETYYDSMIIDHILRGMQWALGDLKAEMVLGK